MRVYKYEVPVTSIFMLYLPTGAKILNFQTQREEPTIWALVDETLPEEDTEQRTFFLVGTGHDVPDLSDLIYIGTTLMAGGDLVWHLFEKGDSHVS